MPLGATEAAQAV
jgi:hypothetical protein